MAYRISAANTTQCPRCLSSCIVPCNTGVRCNQCGLQMSGVVGETPKSYISYASPNSPSPALPVEVKKAEPKIEKAELKKEEVVAKGKVS